MTESTMVSRRSIAKGSAWAAPAIVLGAAAPATAASPQPGLQGWVQVSTQCLLRGQSITIDGRGDYPDRGLWVFNAPPSTIKNAAITFYFENGLGTLTWTGSSGGWSTPVVDNSVPAISGYTAYTTRYSGSWTSAPNASPPYSYADSQPYFATSVTGCQTIRVYAYRTVTVNGQVYSFRRGPVVLALNSFRSQSSPQDASTGADQSAATPTSTESADASASSTSSASTSTDNADASTSTSGAGSGADTSSTTTDAPQPTATKPSPTTEAAPTQTRIARARI